MEFLEAMNAYFRGEKLEAFLFIIPAGLLMIAGAYFLWRGEARMFALGGIIPLIAFGLILIQFFLQTFSAVSRSFQRSKPLFAFRQVQPLSAVIASKIL